MYVDLDYTNSKSKNYILTVEGKFTYLRNKNFLVMSNEDNLTKFYEFLKEVEGKVLILGLGLGYCVKYLLKYNDISSILVIEKDQEIIDLIKPFLKDERLTIKQGDAFTYEIEEEYNTIINDIWYYICEETNNENNRLRNKFKGSFKKYFSPLTKT
tara:strand:+ start:1473 stop:1940 length:468 start_codon:yes stop_codon:yes gene_type:complete